MTSRLREMVEEWLSDYSSDNTRRAYEGDFLGFVEWCERNGHEPLGIRRLQGNRFRTYLIDQGHSDETVARKVAALRSFFEYWLQEGELDVNPMRFVRHKFDRGISSKTRGLTVEECQALMRVAEAEGERDFILCGLMVYCGCRVGEVVDAKAENLGEQEGIPILWIRGKGSKMRTVRIPVGLAAVIDRYLDGRTKGPLLCPLPRRKRNDFPPLKGEENMHELPIRPITRHGAWRRFKTLVAKAGLSAELSPHSARHFAATEALNQGTELHITQDFLGHANPATTQHYNRNRHHLAKNPSPVLEQIVRGVPDDGYPVIITCSHCGQAESIVCAMDPEVHVDLSADPAAYVLIESESECCAADARMCLA